MDASAAGSSDFGTGRLFLADSRLALAVLNHTRYQAVERVFGISRQNANIFTAILALTAANVALERAARVFRGPLGLTGGDAAIGVAALREGAARITGPGAADAPLLGTLLTIGIVGGLAAPTLRRAGRSIRAAEHRVRERRIGLYRAAMRAARTDTPQ